MAEVPLVFGNTALNFTFSPSEHSIISAVQTSIASFAAGGNVSGWPVYDKDARMGWIINETAKAGPLAGKDKVCATIWDGAGYVH